MAAQQGSWAALESIHTTLPMQPPDRVDETGPGTWPGLARVQGARSLGVTGSGWKGPCSPSPLLACLGPRLLTERSD